MKKRSHIAALVVVLTIVVSIGAVLWGAIEDAAVRRVETPAFIAASPETERVDEHVESAPIEDDPIDDVRRQAPVETHVESEPVDSAPMLLPGQSTENGGKKPRTAPKWKSAVLQIVTNFDKADITINGIPYPEYVEPGQPDGVVLPAGGPYDVRVTYNGKTKNYRLNLRPNETRLLFVELTGFQGGGASTPPPKPVAKPEKKEEKAEEKQDDKKEAGKVTVYSKPSGVIMIDGNKTGEKTPGTVEVENGRHEVQVEYDHGEVSEKKIVRVRQGSRIKLFFRARKAPEE